MIALKRKVSLLIVLVFSFLLAGATANAAPVNYLSGQIQCRDGSCYMVHRRDGQIFQRKFGTMEYLQEWQRITGQRGGQYNNETFYPTWGLVVDLPCGQIAQDNSNNRLFMVENVNDPASPFDPDKFNYSDAREMWIPNLNDPTLRYIVTRPGAIKHYSRISASAQQDAYGGPHGGGPQISSESLPTCLIVNQTGTNEFYRITGYYPWNSVGVRVSKKSYIGNNELLNLWLTRNGSFISADLTALPSDPPAVIPPAMLVRSVSDPQVYFIDDHGEKWAIASKADFDKLGFTVNDVNYLSDSTLMSMPTAGTWTP